MNLNQIQDHISNSEQNIDNDCYQVSDSDDSYNSNNDVNLEFNFQEDENENNLLTNILNYFFSLFNRDEKKTNILLDDN